MKIALLEPFYTGSHKRWADSLQSHSSHEIAILSLPGRHWKWRMHGAAISLAKQYEQLEKPDLILATDMLDLSTFLGLIRHLPKVPVALYFHENQLTYPWSPTDQDVQLQRDNHYAWINYTSALVGDKVFFNSNYHRNSFLSALPAFLQQFPDYRSLDNIDELAKKCSVLHLGMNLPKPKVSTRHPRKNILWNHRWEYDKNPEAFFQLLYELSDADESFGLIVTGEKYKHSPKIFAEAERRLQEHIIHWGFVKNKKQYDILLLQADLLPVTSNQDFFGGSVVEAIAAGVVPLLPRRLAYPEHIPKELKEQLIYDEPQELLSMVWDRLHAEKLDDMSACIDHVQKYNWERIITFYDKEFTAL